MRQSLFAAMLHLSSLVLNSTQMECSPNPQCSNRGLRSRCKSSGFPRIFLDQPMLMPYQLLRTLALLSNQILERLECKTALSVPQRACHSPRSPAQLRQASDNRPQLSWEFLKYICGHGGHRNKSRSFSDVDRHLRAKHRVTQVR